MNHLFKHGLLSLCVLPAILHADPLNTGDPSVYPRAYKAVYQVLRNYKDVARVTVGLSHQHKLWTLHGYTHDTRGMAKFLRIKGAQTTTGTWGNGRFIPDEYEQSFSLIGYKRPKHNSSSQPNFW